MVNRIDKLSFVLFCLKYILGHLNGRDDFSNTVSPYSYDGSNFFLWLVLVV